MVQTKISHFLFPLLLCLSPLVFTQTPELIFHSGFEPGSTDTTDGVVSDIFGMDNSVSPPNDWYYDLDLHPNIGNFSIQYQGGDSTMRMATIVDDPTDPSNNVLHYWLKQPNVGGTKGRVQANLYENVNLKEVYQSVRLFLPSADWNLIKDSGGIVTWMTVMEFWNNMYPLDPLYPFRITLGIHKLIDTSSTLTFSLEAQRMELPAPWPIVWAEYNTDFSVPVDQWMTLEIYFKEGDASSGRFMLTVTPDGEEKHTIFDVTNFTHHPSDPAPNGFARYNPMKLYTSDAVINYVRFNGGILQLYWDDFELWKDTNLVTLGTPELENIEYDVRVFPNPMSESTLITFNNQAHQNLNLNLYDSQGRLVRSISNITNNEIRIEKNNLVRGLYFFSLEGEKKSSVGKIYIL
ncbi:MAG: T9SS type A sorting domain-containing protein [Crocinitomix sp.]|nr:T9SS type A sorting domain-containing protein [Crocinitomix sp.]